MVPVFMIVMLTIRNKLSVYFHTNVIDLKPALCASVFGRAPETFMFNAFDIRGKSRFFLFHVC